MNSLVGQRFQRQSIPACLALASSFWFYRKCSCDDHHPTRRRVFWPWARRQLPRRIHQGDIDLTMSPRCIRERQNDENQLRRLIEEAQNSGDAISHQSRLYELLYGSGVTPQDRQNFLAQYGCTGWTPKILERITEIAKDRGIVEVGAGHGQWARALMDHVDGKPDFCLAYDNFSNLPLKGAPLVFPVRQCSPDLHCLAQWSARGRVLLLVFPPPTDLAVQAARVYTDCHTQTDDNVPVIIYVGEGRGGANANDEFFDELESGDWILEEVLPCHSFGSKGREKLFIFRVRMLHLIKFFTTQDKFLE